MKVLEIKNLKKTYQSPEGDSHLVVNVDHFSLAEGEALALAGESGSGKTTFLNLIAGILKADAGTIQLAGEEMESLSESARDLVRARSLGYIFQTFNLLQGYTALENVELGMMFGRGVDSAYAESLLERVGMKNRLQYLPKQMSVGQQQRVAVARALANHPKLVLADEPTGNLDHERAMESLALIRQICKENGAALLLVSHDREVLSKFSKVENLGRINRLPAAAGHGRAGK
jgi:ABC-type lipoprotein export system ATPase subunit